MFQSECFKICHTFGIRQSTYFLLFVFNFSWNETKREFSYSKKIQSTFWIHFTGSISSSRKSFISEEYLFSVTSVEKRERRGTLRHLLLGDFAIEVLAATHNLHFLHLFKFKSYLSIHHQFTCLFIFGNGFFFGRIMMREKRDGTYS